MARKKVGANRLGVHVVLERSTIAIGAVCFLLFNVIVFAAGFISGISTSRTSEERQNVQPVQPIASPMKEVVEQAAHRAPDTTAFVTTSQFAYMSLPDLYRTLVQQGGSVDDVLSTQDDAGLVPDGSTAHVEEEIMPETDVDPSRYAVQLGAYETVESAREGQAGVRAIGYEPEVVRSVTPSGNPVYLLILSRHRSLIEADEAAKAYSGATGNNAVAVPYRRSPSYRDAYR